MSTPALWFVALLALAVLGVLVYLERRDLLPAWVSVLAGAAVAGVALVAAVLLRAARSTPERPDAPQTPWSAQEARDVAEAQARLAAENERLVEVVETTDPDVRSEALSDLLNRRRR